MTTLTAKEMGFPEDLRTFSLSVALKGGYPVGNAGDAHPKLQGVAPQGDSEILYQTFDGGPTWTPVGEFRKNQFDDWALEWYDKKEGEL